MNPHQSTHISQPTTHIIRPASVNPQSTHISQPTSVNPHQSTCISQPTSVIPHLSFLHAAVQFGRFYIFISRALVLAWTATTHRHQQEHQGLDCHNTLTPARTPRLGLSQHTDTSKNTKVWTVTTHRHQQEHQGLDCRNTPTPARTPRLH